MNSNRHFTHDELIRIPDILSAPRFATYLQKCESHKQDAMSLYQWNLEISSSFIVPLHIFEIAIRNAVVNVLEGVHSSNWHLNQGFVITLPSPKTGYNPRKDLVVLAKRHPKMGKVVAELKFMFWQKMFTHRYDRALWLPHLKSAFPNAPHDNAIALRKDIHDSISKIRKLRNRIAHHEPIFTRDLQDDYDAVYRLVSWRDTTTAEWMHKIQNVTTRLHERPKHEHP